MQGVMLNTWVHTYLSVLKIMLQVLRTDEHSHKFALNTCWGCMFGMKPLLALIFIYYLCTPRLLDGQRIWFGVCTWWGLLIWITLGYIYYQAYTTTHYLSTYFSPNNLTLLEVAPSDQHSLLIWGCTWTCS